MDVVEFLGGVAVHPSRPSTVESSVGRHTIALDATPTKSAGSYGSMSSRSSVCHSVARRRRGRTPNSLSRTRQNRHPARFSSRSVEVGLALDLGAHPVLAVALDRQPAAGARHDQVDVAPVDLHLRGDVEAALVELDEDPLVEQGPECRVRLLRRDAGQYVGHQRRRPLST